MVPVGEGWTRHNSEMLVHPPSQVYFAQRGEQRGKYFLKGDGGGWTVCPAPHVSMDCPIEVRAAAASVLRPLPPTTSGGRPSDAERKFERAVVIAEMPKTARLALRFPLGFLDTPACAYALFSGLRGSAAAAHWCASQFHQRLLPEVAKRIHGWWDSEAEMPEELLFRGSHVGSLAVVLREHLESLDRDLRAGPHGFGGCDAAVAVLVGESFVVAVAGQASATLLFDDAEPIPLLPLEERDFESTVFGKTRAGHASEQGALLSSSGLLRRAKSAWDAEVAASDSATQDAVVRILRAPDAFALLGVQPGGPDSAAEVRATYKRLALRAHPDKVRGCDPLDAKAAFERLETAAKAVEALMELDATACRELHRVLGCDPFTLKGAAAALQVDPDADEKQVEKAAAKMKDALSKVQSVRDVEGEVRRCMDTLRESQETLRIARHGNTPGASGERLLLEGVGAANAGGLGLRDLHGLGVSVEVRTASWRAGEALRVALCCGATAELNMEVLEGSACWCQWQPKAAALQWANKALALPGREGDTSATAICVCIRDRCEEDADAPAADDLFGLGRPAKKHKGMPGPKSVRVRHLLLRCAEPGKPLLDDPMARKKKKHLRNGEVAAVVRSPAEAEADLVELLKDLLSQPAPRGDAGLPSVAAEEADAARRKDDFRKLCQQRSECESADNAGQLCGDLGWISRGQVEAPFEQAAFGLRVGDFSDVITTSRGVHVIQRLA